jgi:hypothetical protein
MYTTNAFFYAHGGDGFAGIATISGDAGGLGYLDEALSAQEVLDTIDAVAWQECILDEDSDALAKLLADAKEQLELIHAAHVERFESYRNS